MLEMEHQGNPRIENARKKFLNKLKEFLKTKYGDFIYDYISNHVNDLHKISAYKFVDLDIEIDLFDMIYYDGSLASNFIRCLARYYQQISIFIKEIFLEKYSQDFQGSNLVRKGRDKLVQILANLEQNLYIKMNLKLSHFPYSVESVNPKTLLNNSILREHGQLIKIKLSRVVNVFETSTYVYSKIYDPVCSCQRDFKKIIQVQQNPIRVFKNQVQYSSKVAKSLYYDLEVDSGDIRCQDCNLKYKIINEQYAPCQKVEILALSDKGRLKNLQANIIALWIIEPFVNQVQIGDVICLTGYYFMTPLQSFINGRSISEFNGQIVAFDIEQVNPFNQMIGKDSQLAQAFFNPQIQHSPQTSKASSSISNPLLTVGNMRMHEQIVRQANQKFVPKMNRLINMVHNTKNQKSASQFNSTYSMFQAIYQEEYIYLNNRLPEDHNMSAKLTQPLTQEDFQETLVRQIVQIDEIEHQFGKIHLLVDKIFEGYQEMQNNSYLFHLKFSLLLSSVVQMKNSLMKYLDYEAKEKEPGLNIWTQHAVIDKDYFNVGENVSETIEEVDYELDKFSVLSPMSFDHSRIVTTTNQTPFHFRDNLNLLIIFDDLIYLEFLFKTMKRKGTNIVELPSQYDMQSLIAFFLINDHSIIVVRNPRKDILAIIKAIMAKGILPMKTGKTNQRIKVNITLWLIIELQPLIDKNKTLENKQGQRKKVTEMIQKEYGVDFIHLFDIALDLTQYTHLSNFGTRQLSFQDNHMLDRFAENCSKVYVDLTEGKIYNFKELKCTCDNKMNAQNNNPEDESILFPELKLSIGENFIQLYYLHQRDMHREQDYSRSFPEESFKHQGKTWMSLSDVVKVKKLADDVHFMRLFYLKSSQDHIYEKQQDLNEQKSNTSHNKDGLEIIDCVMAIFLFEITRVCRSGNSLYCRDHFAFQIFHFFTNLKLSKIESDQEKQEEEKKKANKGGKSETNVDQDQSPLGINRQRKFADMTTTGRNIKSTVNDFIKKRDLDDDDEILQNRYTDFTRQNQECSNCKCQIKKNKSFCTLYKYLIDSILRSIQ